MKIEFDVKPNAREEKIEKISDTHFKINVMAPPTEGKANRAVEVVIAKYFKVAPSLVMVTGGLASRHKIVTISL